MKYKCAFCEKYFETNLGKEFNMFNCGKFGCMMKYHTWSKKCIKKRKPCEVLIKDSKKHNLRSYGFHNERMKRKSSAYSRAVKRLREENLERFNVLKLQEEKKYDYELIKNIIGKYLK